MTDGEPRYRLLGPVGVVGDAGALRTRGPKQRAVLAALLLHANRVVSEDLLFSLVWGDDFPPSMRGQLQVHVSGLRKLLGPDAIERHGPGYLMRVRPGELDLQLFAGPRRAGSPTRSGCGGGLRSATPRSRWSSGKGQRCTSVGWPRSKPSSTASSRVGGMRG